MSSTASSSRETHKASHQAPQGGGFEQLNNVVRSSRYTHTQENSGVDMPRQSFYDEIELEDLAYDEAKDLFHYPCPCGDRFEISRKQLKDGEDVAKCPSCSLIIRVIFDPLDFEEDDEEGQQEAVKEEMMDSQPMQVATAA